MNTTTTGVMVRTLNSSKKFDSLTISDNGIVMQFGKKTVSEISYSELEKIYIKVYKLKHIYGSILVSFPLLLAFLCFESIQLNVELYLALLPVIPAFVKINRFKRYGLVMTLKNGSVFTKKVPLRLKTDTIELINEVKRKSTHFNLHHPKVNTVSIDCTEAAIELICKTL